MTTGKAIVTVARKLLVAVWYVLTHQQADRHADPHIVGLKFFAWSWKLSAEQHEGLTRRQFVRYHLMHIQRRGTKRGNETSARPGGGSAPVTT
jgi:hypothetical protein